MYTTERLDMVKILIVDDRPINREVLSLLLDENNYEVFEAEDGLQALDLARKTPPDLIITDIAMPRFDGVSLAKELNLDPMLSSIPVIFYSATYKAAEAYQIASTSNVKYVLTKPCEPEIILGTIEGALDPLSTFFNNRTSLALKPQGLEKEFNSVHFEKISKKEKLTDQNLRLTNLIEIGLDMSMEHDIKKLIYIMCKSGRQFLNASYAGIILEKTSFSQKYNNFYMGAHNKFLSSEFETTEFSEYLKEIFIYDKAMCIHSPVIEIEKIGLKEVGLPLASLLTLPLRTARTLYGKIYFINKSNEKIFTLSNQRFMRTLADKFSINYENLLLYKEVERYSQQLENEIKQRKQTEEKLHIYRNQMAEVMRLSSLEELASSLAHEVNQPLAAISAYIKGCIKRIEKSKEITPEIIEILNETVFQAERAGEVIHRVKSFVRKGELFFELIDCHPFIKEVIHLFQQELQNCPVEIKYSLMEKLPKLKADKIQLQQVILNLLRNAIEAMLEAKTENPKINIEIKRREPNYLMFLITDNGPGFPLDLENNIFELYFTTKSQGMGMGLAICRSIVEAHLGHISAQVLPEGGSCFQFDLPFENTYST